MAMTTPTPAMDQAAAAAASEAAPVTGAGSTNPAVRTIRMRVFRWRPGGGAPRHDRFDVPVAPRSSILDALTYIRRRLDPTLNLRHSCCHASCGTCGMRVNGRDVLACVTIANDLGTDEVVVEPLLNAPVVSDLVVDMTDFFAAFNPMDRPLIRRAEVPVAATPPADLDGYVRFEDCIECGICLSACPVAAADPRYLGPAALAAAARVAEEPRGADAGQVLRLTDTTQGLWRCHVTFECTEACPSAVDPAARIMGLRQRAMRRRLGIGRAAKGAAR